MEPHIRTRTSAKEVEGALDALAGLRISVFREWPYLYDGSKAYEMDYLKEFAQEDGAVLITAEVAGTIIGAATASPMTGQKEAFQAPFRNGPCPVDQLFYFGESVLLPQFRNQGIGHAFFDAREAAVRQAGASHACFCAIIRPENHPMRPAGARNLHSFWRSRGYTAVPGLVTEFGWKDVDQPAETSHPMQYWMRRL